MMPYQARSLGAYVELAHLISYQLAAKHLRLEKNQRALNQLSGGYRTHIRGRGIDFNEVRQYQAGDDIRSIDWRVSARSGKTYVKQFYEEREKNVLIAVDQRQTQFFGSTLALKSVLAADIAAYIAWAAHHKGDRVGGLIFNDHTHIDCRPQRLKKSVLQFLQHLHNFNHQLTSFAPHPTRAFSDVLQELKRVSKPGSQIFLISDFHDVDHQCTALLRDLSQHNEIIALQTFDPMEMELPPAGTYCASSGSKRYRFDTSNNATRQRYTADFMEARAQLRTLMGQYNISLIPVSTQESPLTTLQTYLGQPMRHAI